MTTIILYIGKLLTVKRTDGIQSKRRRPTRPRRSSSVVCIQTEQKIQESRRIADKAVQVAQPQIPQAGNRAYNNFTTNLCFSRNSQDRYSLTGVKEIKKIKRKKEKKNISNQRANVFKTISNLLCDKISIYVFSTILKTLDWILDYRVA